MGVRKLQVLHNIVDEGYKQNRKEKDKRRNYYSIYGVQGQAKLSESLRRHYPGGGSSNDRNGLQAGLLKC